MNKMWVKDEIIYFHVDGSKVSVWKVPSWNFPKKNIGNKNRLTKVKEEIIFSCRSKQSFLLKSFWQNKMFCLARSYEVTFQKEMSCHLLLSVYFWYQCSFWQDFTMQLFNRKLGLFLHESISFHFWLLSISIFFLARFTMKLSKKFFASTWKYSFVFDFCQYIFNTKVLFCARFCKGSLQKEIFFAFTWKYDFFFVFCQYIFASNILFGKIL